MASVNCTYTYRPTPESEQILNASTCASTYDTTIIVPTLSVSRPYPTDCETTVLIKYHVSNPPPGGLEITHVYVDFYFDIVRGGSVGSNHQYAQKVDFPGVGNEDMGAGTFTYEIPNPLQILDGQYIISFWPQNSYEGEILSQVKISDVSLRMTYKDLAADPDIGAPQNIQVYNGHWARIAAKWTAPECANGKHVNHYSVAAFAIDAAGDQSLEGGRMVSDGWRSFTGTYGFIPLLEPQPNKDIFIKIMAISTQNKKGVLAYSNGSQSISSPIRLDTLQDSNEVMFSFGNMRLAYNHVAAQANYIGAPSAPAWPYTNATDRNILQSDYDTLAGYVGAEEIPDLPRETLMTRSQWTALIAKV